MSDPRTDLESALREAASAVRDGRPGELITITAAGLWRLRDLLYAQDKMINKLRGKRGQNR